MALALYRKWRSQTFEELVGQEHVVKTLRNAIVAGRIGHAYLFTGPRGVGKTSVARLLAKAVNCQAEPEQRPCDRCDSCRQVSEGRAVDVIEMDAASNRGVDDAREIIERVQFRPTSSRYKVYIIDEVHMLTTEAFNALLKTLEEPPPHAMFILATTEVHKVPATIGSRCQRFVFNRHSIPDMASHLQRIAQAEGVALEPEAAEVIARAATGSLRDAVSVLDQLMAYGEATIRAPMVRALLGASAAEEVRALIQALVDADTAAALRALNAVADQGADLRQFARDLVQELRTLLLIKAGAERALIEVGDEALAELQALAERLEAARLLAWLKLFSGLDQQLRSSPYGQLPLELAVVEALLGPPAAAPAAPQGGLPAGSRPAAPAVPVQRPTAPRPAPQPVQEQAPELPPVPGPQRAEVPAPQAAPPQPELPEAAEAAPPRAPVPVAAPADEPEVEQFMAPPVAPVAQEQWPAPGAAADEAAPAGPASTDVEVLLAQIEEQWATIVENVKPHSTTVQALLRSCEPIGIDEALVVVGARSPFHRDNLEKLQNRRIVEQVLSKTMGRTLGIRCELMTVEQQNNARDARRQREELLKDPVVRAARNIFEATILGIQHEDLGS